MHRFEGEKLSNLTEATWRTPKLLDRLNYKSTVKTMEGWGVGVHSLVRNT